MNSATKRLLSSPIKLQNGNSPKKVKLEQKDPAKPPECDFFDKENNLHAFFDDDEEFDLHLAEIDKKAKINNNSLDLTNFKRCIVDTVELDTKTYSLILQVHEDVSVEEEPAASSCTCHLRGAWSHTQVAVGDIISLQGKWHSELNAYVVDQDQGYCVTNPDLLIPATSVMGSLFCKRRSILQERFRGVDANSKVMVIGSLVHELLQTVLRRNVATLVEIQQVAKALFQEQNIAYMLYESKLTCEEVIKEVLQFLPHIVSFMQQYVQGKEPKQYIADNFQGQIAEIQDIEENVWVPQLGLKGKIDVSVRIQRQRNKLNLEKTKPAIPLELKTGRATFSMEHKGQLILYQMMLTALGQETHTGLLFYLREGILREIPSKRNEQRDLLTLRNDLSHYLTRTPILPPTHTPLSSQGKNGEIKLFQPLELPEPISHHGCKNCAYATICCSFAKTDDNLKLREGHPLLQVMQESTEHLQPADLEYFIKWCSLLLLEEQEAKQSNYMRDLWTLKPELRQEQGRAIAGLQLSDHVVTEESRYLHTFKLSTQHTAREVDLTLTGFSPGEYVIVSTTKRLAVGTGCIANLSSIELQIGLERNLLQKYARESFIIDKHESQQINVFNFTNLGLLLEDTPRANELRAFVIKKKQPTYRATLPKIVAKEGVPVLKHLNKIQRSAVIKSLTTDSFVLIKGLPGTGKTQTLVALVRVLHLMRKSVLLTSYTHSAVDNLLLRLKLYALPILRLGSSARVHPDLMEYSEAHLLKDCHTVAELEQKYAAPSIVGVTCLGASHALFLHRKFDFCIVDEATQVMQPTVLRALYFCEKFILVGDPDQLPPLIRAREARLRGADESLFQLLDTPTATCTLTLQYRMNKTITKLANELTYGGALQCANEELKTAAIKFQLPPLFKTEKWIHRALQIHVEQAVFLLDTLDCVERSFSFATAKHSKTCATIEASFAEEEEKKKPTTSSPVANTSKSQSRRLSKYTNYCDAALVFRIVTALLLAGYDAARIGIIAPYRAQVELLRKLAAQHQLYYEKKPEGIDLNFVKVEVNTVDQYQGRDKDIILYSCAKTGTPTGRELERTREGEVLEDKRRLTVAITRAKLKLILIGDAACLQQYSPFRTLLASIPGFCKLKLENGKFGFQWQDVMERLGEVIAT